MAHDSLRPVHEDMAGWRLVRLFVGIPLPPAPTYAAVTRTISERVPGLRPVPDGSWHITLRFLGEVLDRKALEVALVEAVRGRSPLSAVVEGIGAFPSAKHGRIVWAGVRAPGIEALAASVERATAGFGEPPEPRRFVAHATLGRLARPADLRSVVTSHVKTLFASGLLDRVVLYDSLLDRSGPRYVEARSFALMPQP
jgi:2'-5' RNA ligase